MRILARYGFPAIALGVLIALPACSAPTDPFSATAVCAGTFQVDGSTVSNTASLSRGSKIETTTGTCTIQRSGGTSIRLEPQSGIVLTETGLNLISGTIRIKGNANLGLTSGKSAIHPTDNATVINARFLNNLFYVNVANGNASIVGSNSELYGRLGTGTLMVLAPAPNESSGMYLWVSGCLHSMNGNWSLGDQHIYGPVQLEQETIRKDGQPVGIWGSMEQLSPQSQELAVRLQVVQEKTRQQACPAFTASSNLEGTAATNRTERIAEIIAALAGFGALEGASQPGQPVTFASIP